MRPHCWIYAVAKLKGAALQRAQWIELLAFFLIYVSPMTYSQDNDIIS